MASAGLQIIDVSNPASPVLVGAYDTSDFARDVYVSGSLAYVADWRAGLQVIDVSNPASPIRRGGYDTSGYAYDVFVSGSLAYIADRDAGLQIIDVSNPANPVRRRRLSTSARCHWRLRLRLVGLRRGRRLGPADHRREQPRESQPAKQVWHDHESNQLLRLRLAGLRCGS